jgi:hypothetical protein
VACLKFGKDGKGEDHFFEGEILFPMFKETKEVLRGGCHSSLHSTQFTSRDKWGQGNLCLEIFARISSWHPTTIKV